MRIAAIVLLLVAAACSKSNPSSSPSPSSSVASAATPTATPCSVTGASAAKVSSPSSASEAAVSDVRYSDSGCPSIVFQFQGDHTPGYTIGYASPPFSDCGSGAEVATSSWGADHYLQMKLEPSGGVDLSKSPNPTYTGPRDIAVNRPTLKHLKVTCDFEAVFTWIAGVHGQPGFKVQTLGSPPRIVVSLSQG